MAEREPVDFYKRLATIAQDQGDPLIAAIVNNAKAGDASSLKILEKALVDSKFDVEQTVKITNDQFKKIIILAAERFQKS